MEDELEPVIEQEEKEEKPEENISVNLDEKKETPKEERKPESKQPAFDERKIHNAVGFQVRQQVKALKDELLAEIRSLKEANKPQEAKETQQELDEIDQLAQKDWKAAVRKLAQEESSRNLQQVQTQRQQDEAQRLKNQLVERSKSFVLSQYPQLSDSESDETKTFTQVWNENPTLWNNPEGYRLAMYEMEERMRAMGKSPKRVKQDVDKEVRRQLRANVSSVVGHSGNGSNGKYILTKEQQKIADELGIKYEDYAKTAAALENKEDITT